MRNNSVCVFNKCAGTVGSRISSKQMRTISGYFNKYPLLTNAYTLTNTHWRTPNPDFRKSQNSINFCCKTPRKCSESIIEAISVLNLLSISVFTVKFLKKHESPNVFRKTQTLKSKLLRFDLCFHWIERFTIKYNSNPPYNNRIHNQNSWKKLWSLCIPKPKQCRS